MCGYRLLLAALDGHMKVAVDEQKVQSYLRNGQEPIPRTDTNVGAMTNSEVIWYTDTLADVVISPFLFLIAHV